MKHPFDEEELRGPGSGRAKAAAKARADAAAAAAGEEGAAGAGAGAGAAVALAPPPVPAAARRDQDQPEDAPKDVEDAKEENPDRWANFDPSIRDGDDLNRGYSLLGFCVTAYLTLLAVRPYLLIEALDIRPHWLYLLGTVPAAGAWLFLGLRFNAEGCIDRIGAMQDHERVGAVMMALVAVFPFDFFFALMHINYIRSEYGKALAEGNVNPEEDLLIGILGGILLSAIGVIISVDMVAMFNVRNMEKVDLKLFDAALIVLSFVMEIVDVGSAMYTYVTYTGGDRWVEWIMLTFSLLNYCLIWPMVLVAFSPVLEQSTANMDPEYREIQDRQRELAKYMAFFTVDFITDVPFLVLRSLTPQTVTTALQIAFSALLLAASGYSLFAAYRLGNHVTYCPDVQCGWRMAYNPAVPKTTCNRKGCPMAKDPFCGRCKVAWHDELTCERFQDMARRARSIARKQRIELMKKVRGHIRAGMLNADAGLYEEPTVEVTDEFVTFSPFDNTAEVFLGEYEVDEAQRLKELAAMKAL